MRFSITASLVATAVVALGTAAIIYRNALWTNFVVTAVLAATVASAAIAWASATKRSFCVPFTVIAGAYLAIVFLDPLAPFEKQLITSRLLFAAWTQIAMSQNEDALAVMPEDRYLYFYSRYQDDKYVRLGSPYEPLGTTPQKFKSFYYPSQALIALAVGSLAGIVFAGLSRHPAKRT